MAKSYKATTLCHWGPIEATVEDGRLICARPFAGSGADEQMIGAWPELLYSPTRIDRPHVRRAFLEHGHLAERKGRGTDDMVPVSWDVALDLVGEQLARVYGEHGPSAVFGGSYGWSSAGRFHHARTQVRRFLSAAGGFVDQTGNYSWGAAHALLPHVLGNADAVARSATSWKTIAAQTDVFVAFGGLNPKNWRVTSGGAGGHHQHKAVLDAQAGGTRFFVLSPLADDVPQCLDATLIKPRPNSDTAIMLALAHQAVITGRADLTFLERYTSGASEFIAYLHGEKDGQPKTLSWAAQVADVPESQLADLWTAIAKGRVMLSAAWSLQRADHGEQPFWALIALAAMLGQIGLPGGGFCFGYGSMNAVGADSRKGFVPAMPGLPNPCSQAVPVACFADAFLNPGRTIAFNGQAIEYPDVRLVYWAGGNPFHHAQDLNRVREAWQRPEAIIVHEPWWTPTARHADIVLPATTPFERNDIGGSGRDPHVFAMPKVIDPVGQARNDFDIFCALADRLECRSSFDDGLDEMGWLRRLWQQALKQGEEENVDVPDFDRFWAEGFWRVPPPDEAEIMLADFRAAPQAAPLATPSGRIELCSQTIKGFGYADCPPHPTWLEPAEWLGNAAPDAFHLVTNQPAKQLHSQLYQTRADSDPQCVRIHPDDAKRHNIEDQMIVRLFNERGSCRAKAQWDESLRRSVLVMPTGAWFAPDPETGLEQNGNPNVLTADKQTSQLGQACAALSTLVQIAPMSKALNKGSVQ